MRVLVCGSRNWENERMVVDTIEATGILDLTCKERVIISGLAKGPDLFAWRWSEYINEERGGIQFFGLQADWKRHGRAAGMIRNRKMLKQGKPDLVLAFWDGTSKGTLNMIELARKAGVEVRVIREETPNANH